jgi:tetratricopeptide (TPR) repeat protein
MEVDTHTSMTEQGHFRLGEAQFALHDYPSAEKAYAKALEVSPEDATIKKRLTLTHEAISGFYFRQVISSVTTPSCYSMYHKHSSTCE